jgi:hypothetical protein
MVDEELKQGSQRKEGGIPTAKAKKAYVKIRSGYGLEIKMDDANSQEETQNQSIQIYSPQRDNKDRGPHILRMQEKSSGPGLVYLQVGGNYICVSRDDHMTFVGDKDKNPSDYMVFSSRHSFIITEKNYFNSAELHAFKAKQMILLMAGEDCQDVNGKMGPCVWPVLCLSDRGITISDRVYVSASKKSSCASIFHLTPFHLCSKEN